MNTPSPRTFAAIEEYRKYGGSPRNEPVFSSDMFALEDELTAVIDQRDRLMQVIEAATILIAAKGRHNTMLAYNGLRDALESIKQPKKYDAEDHASFYP